MGVWVCISFCVTMLGDSPMAYYIINCIPVCFIQSGLSKRHCTQPKNVYSAYVPGLVSSRIKTNERVDRTPAVILMSNTFLWNPHSPICQLCSPPDKFLYFNCSTILVFDHRLSVWMHLSEAELWAINVLYAHRKKVYSSRKCSIPLSLSSFHL